MKLRTGFFFIGLLVLSCNNSSNEPVTKQDLPIQEKEMKEAISKYPDSVLLKQNLIQYYQDNGSIEMALVETNKALAKDSGDASFWDKKAELYALQDDTSNAINAYEHAISIYPDPQYVMSLGWLYAKTKNSKAIEMGDALLEAKKAHAEKEGMLIKGLYYAATGNTNQALVYFDNALSMDYTFMFAYREKAIVLFNLGKYEEAITVLSKAVTLQNKFDEGYYWIAKCYEKLNNRDNAIKNYKLALLYNPDFIEASDALGKLGIK